MVPEPVGLGTLKVLVPEFAGVSDVKHLTTPLALFQTEKLPANLM